MIIDKLCNISKYPQLGLYKYEIIKFIQRCTDGGLPEEGKYELDGDLLFALVQKYVTKNKEDSFMESHLQYADFQYIIKGNEMVFYDFADELIIRENKSIQNDIIFYQKNNDKGGIILTEGMFGYFEPQDAHMPCIKVTDVATSVIKVVFKIKLKR
ncbi:MAG: YhcH/YjgK/YiaL family protein [Lachnospiraceae bacterium]|nr:YhcH/YjgK/YiaL family protein [Lachnospiraceae bacterium]